MTTKFSDVLAVLQADIAAYNPDENTSIKSKSRDISRSEVINRLSYSTETGKFFWKNGPKAGIEAGHCANTRGKSYIRINFNRELILAHVLAWFVVYGTWPTSELDHLDGDGTNNRIDNLRLGNRGINNSNTRKRRDSLAEPNISISRCGNFIAAVKFNRRRYLLGTFQTLELAVEARDIAERLIPRSENHRQELPTPLLKKIAREYAPEVISKGTDKPKPTYTIINNMQIPNDVESIEI